MRRQAGSSTHAKVTRTREGCSCSARFADATRRSIERRLSIARGGRNPTPSSNCAPRDDLVFRDRGGPCCKPTHPAPPGRSGLPPSELTRHIAWDIGALEVARRMSAALDATLVAQNYSRLVIDCNRDPGVATSIPRVGESIDIPGNCHLSAAELEARRLEIFEPYHARVRALLDARAGGGAAHHPGGPAQHDKCIQGREPPHAGGGAVQP